MLEIAVFILDMYIHSRSAKATGDLEQFYQLQSTNLPIWSQDSDKL